MENVLVEIDLVLVVQTVLVVMEEMAHEDHEVDVEDEFPFHNFDI